MKSKLFFILALVIVSAGISVQSIAQIGTENIKICVFSDPHYFDPSLLINDGPAFEEYLTYDRKLLKESNAIMESLIDSLIAEQPDIVLISGDLTKDGELICHQQMAGYFSELENAGAQVFVCPGNHDINNPHALAYDNDMTYPVPNITPEDFVTIYHNFGYGQAIAKDTASLSYVAEPIPGLQILSMDVCRYDSNYIQNYPQTSGGFEPPVLQWVKDRIIDARSMGKVIIALEHHNLVEHFTNQKVIFGEYVIDDWESIYSELADLGLKVVFTGHFHAQDIRSINSPSGNIIYDIETGSTVTWPCPYRICILDTDTVLSITGKKVENIDYDTGSQTFQEYALESLETGIPASIIFYLTSPPYNIDQGTAEFVEPAFTETLIAHYNGNEGNPSFSTNFIIWTLNLSGYGYIADALESAWDDFAPDDWNTNINLTPSGNKIYLDLTVMLEGPFNGSNLSTNLNPDYLPLNQPYLELPWFFTGCKETPDISNPQIVDWVMVEIRDAVDASSAAPDKKVARLVGFILDNGHIVSTDGSSIPAIHYSPEDQLFAVVYHRNHLPVMSASPLNLAGNTYSFNFTTGAGQAYGAGLAQKELASGIWGMAAGDGNVDNVIDLSDKSGFWSIFAGKSGYHAGDYNLDGNIGNQDKNDLWRVNLNRETVLPE
ncbi:MAG: metallophosphoesterase [Bacteroidales bacterium]|nr:metallophosphoesterase [Bacteroidales bacterium]